VVGSFGISIYFICRHWFIRDREKNTYLKHCGITTCRITSLFLDGRCTGLIGSVVKLSDLRLVGTKIKNQSRHGIFNINMGSNPEWLNEKVCITYTDNWIYNLFNKGHGLCYPVCGKVHINYPLLLIRKSSCSTTGIAVPGYLSSTNINTFPGQTVQEAEMCAHESVF